MAKFWLGKVGNRVEWWLDDVREGFFFFFLSELARLGASHDTARLDLPLHCSLGYPVKEMMAVQAIDGCVLDTQSIKLEHLIIHSTAR